MTDEKGIGHNCPPEPTPFEAISEQISDLYLEAKNWCDGAKIENQAQADCIAELIQRIRKASNDAEALRKGEVKPLDDAKAEIQARYNELIGKTKKVTGLTVKALDALKTSLAPWLAEIERQQREEAEKKQREVAEAARKAQEELAKAREVANLEEREKADAAIREAEKALKEAEKASKAKANVTGGAGKAIGLRTVYTAEVTDYTAAARHLWVTNTEEFKALVDKLAQQHVNAGKRELPGVTVKEERKAV